jgi:outer membrane receptor protein involved in Fe transport
VTYYDQAVEDLIDLVVLDASAQPRIQQYQNIGQIDNTGWELESRLQVAPPLSLRGTFSRTRSVVQRLSPNYTGDLRVGDQLLGVPRSSAGAALTYSSRLVDLNLEATRFGEWTEVDWLSYYGFIFGGKPYRGSLRAYWIDYPSFTKFNVSVGRRFTPALEGFLRVDNVANNRADERVNVDIPLGRVTTVGLRFRS